ncbi:Methyltransferase pytC [Cladobotryum mycophilum]|uniref:Methyltransferase pytC n=1 Tax=Cladobotryum mycophilum TaxID=491253 RepID=A0ABR0T1N0_9HYPO
MNYSHDFDDEGNMNHSPDSPGELDDHHDHDDQDHGDDDDNMSDYGDSIVSEFTTIRSNCLHFEYENGRRYQGLITGRYGLPNDEPEQAREGYKHKLYSDYVLGGKHFLAPIGNNPQKIVDLGCGAGFWPLDVAELYPSAKIIGSDISPIQPPWLPNNVEFHIEDLDDEFQDWTSVYQNADLIYMRSVLQTIRNSELFLDRVYENLKPGGWIECHEIVLPATWEDGTEAPDHPISVLYERMNQGSYAQVYGWEVFLPKRLPEVLRDAGFVNVQEKHTHVPIGRWHSERRSREMGMLNHTIIIDWVAAVMNKYRELGMNEDEADKFVGELLDAMDNNRMHARLDWAAFWAQKPY